jgi:hypothetical protein
LVKSEAATAATNRGGSFDETRVMPTLFAIEQFAPMSVCGRFGDLSSEDRCGAGEASEPGLSVTLRN